MQDTPTTGARADAIELLTTQHRDVDQLWSQAQVARRDGDHDLAQDLAGRIITMLSKHDAIETMLLYPALRQAGGQGDAQADHALEDHQRIRELLADADGRDVDDEGAWQSLRTALDSVVQHVQEEEGQMFPTLRGLGQEKVTELGDAMEKAWKTAPTHPHPSTPNSGIGATVVGAVAGVVDRARDAISGEDRSTTS
jgi:hemerythrin superfamily protein